MSTTPDLRSLSTWPLHMRGSFETPSQVPPHLLMPTLWDRALPSELSNAGTALVRRAWDLSRSLTALRDARLPSSTLPRDGG